MEITWYGLSCFRLRDRALTIITDPYDPSVGLTLPRLRAAVVTVSHDAAGHNNVSAVRGHEHVFDGPGEYEVKGVFITGVATHHKGKVGQRERNTAFLFDFGDISVAHLGDLGAPLDREQIELLSGAGVLLVPVGGGDALDAARAAEVVTALEPSIIIPMHYAQPGLKLKLKPVQQFLKEMGVPAPEVMPSLKITKGDLRGGETQVILLESQGEPS